MLAWISAVVLSCNLPKRDNASSQVTEGAEESDKIQASRMLKKIQRYCLINKQACYFISQKNDFTL